MEVIEVASGQHKPVVVGLMEDKDFTILTKKRYSFDWKLVKGLAVIYKLQIREEDNILGVMGLIDVPEEKRIEIKLLASSIDNQGLNKVYDRVAGCLIAFACQLSKLKYGNEACISLIPKTNLIKHYGEKYHMTYTGWQMYIEGTAMSKLLKEYNS